MDLDSTGEKISKKGIYRPGGQTGHERDHLGEVASIKTIIGIDTIAKLFVVGLFVNSWIEEDSSYRFSEVIEGKLLGTLEYEVRNAFLPGPVADEVRLWGYKRIIVGSLRALSNVEDSARECLFQEVVGCAFRYAARYFPEQMKDENFFSDIFGNI